MLAGHLTALFFGFLLDLCFGDPDCIYHPVCMIGSLIGLLTKKLLPLCHKEKRRERAAGFLLVVIVLVCSAGVPFLLLIGVYKLHFVLGVMLETFWCFQLLAARSLQRESGKVREALEISLEDGRQAVAMIVGRDTEMLDREGVIKAAVETVAENTSDGVVAPLLYMTLFGAVGGFFYKAVNTMDSMIGYQNDTYQYFGTAAARLDDICNLIPARLSALLMIGAAAVCGGIKRNFSSGSQEAESEYYHWKDAWRIWRRDRKNHKSPNSAQTEAACAGALQIRLAGDAYYFGKKCEKPFIGDDIRPVEAADITRAGKLMYVASALVWGLCVAGLLVILLWR